jgi:short-subunit dehydrogenase
MSGRLALVTGASSGIGAAFARIYASHGYDLALSARREDRLAALADEVRLAHGVEALVVPADLADPSAPARLVAEVTAHGHGIDALVNNAGYGVPEAFAESRWEEQAALLQVMVTAPCELAHRVLPLPRVHLDGIPRRQRHTRGARQHAVLAVDGRRRGRGQRL